MEFVLLFYSNISDQQFTQEIDNNPGGSPPYCPKIDITTVTPALISISQLYWDQTQANATSINISNTAYTSDITNWPTGWDDQSWYNNRGAVETMLNTTFYSMSESFQYNKLSLTVNSGGVLDTIGNEYTANPASTTTVCTVCYKFVIDGQGNITILETDF